jgi:hypothetical protein
LPATTTTDGIATSSCAATSFGGASSRSVTVKRDATPPSKPTFSAIAAQTYTPAQLPAAGAIGCAASDATSGIASCAVAGFSAALGTHELIATATDNAGLTSTAPLSYTVVAAPPSGGSAPPPTGGSGKVSAISALTASKARVRVATITRLGVRATLTAARAATKLQVSVTLRGRRVATQARTVRAGKVRLTIKLRRSVISQLRARPGVLTLRVTGNATGTARTTLTAKVKIRR